MQDIDFDELDRAISTTLKPTPTPEPAVAPETAPEPSPSIEPVTTAPAARRSSGRFMDVVHPSSDMRSSSVANRSETRAETREEVSVPEMPEPVTSPFLDDAKVEKRPLGAFSDATPKPTVDLSAELLLEAPDEELLEADNEAPEAPVEEPASEVEDEPVPEVMPEEEIPSTFPTSITQQYKEQPSTSDQPSGAIFDTEAYHQPLTHPEKKKSGAMVILWILVLILVGAAAGAAFYFFALPLL